MGKRGGGGDRRALNSASVSNKPFLSLREENAGRMQANHTVNVKSRLKLEHLQSLALWAAAEASVPSLAALFGHRLASASEALGLQQDPSCFSCQRCETILQPGFNCTVRIEKNQVRSRRRSMKPKHSMQNKVVYNCHFCSHRNIKRGTPQGYMKEMCPPKAKPTLNPECGKSAVEHSTNTGEDTLCKDEVSKVGGIVLSAIAEDAHIVNSPITPLVKTKITLDGKKRRRTKRGTKNSAERESHSATTDDKTLGASTKRRRKISWTSLKEIVEISEHDSGRNTNLAIPFSFSKD